MDFRVTSVFREDNSYDDRLTNLSVNIRDEFI